MKNSLLPRIKQLSVLRRQNGQSMVEFLVILPVMLLLILGTVQVALIYHAKITLNYAAFEAVRAGTLNCDKKYLKNGNGCRSEVSQFDAMKEGLARGLAPLYSYYEPRTEERKGMHDPALNQVEAYQQGRDRVFDELKGEFIRVERLNPTPQAFSEFAVDGVIPNDNLMYRSGASGDSQMSIQDANLLHLRITYWYPMYVPFINKLISKVANCKWDDDEVYPRIPITATAVMRMQVPVEKW